MPLRIAPAMDGLLKALPAQASDQHTDELFRPVIHFGQSPANRAAVAGTVRRLLVSLEEVSTQPMAPPRASCCTSRLDCAYASSKAERRECRPSER